MLEDHFILGRFEIASMRLQRGIEEECGQFLPESHRNKELVNTHDRLHKAHMAEKSVSGSEDEKSIHIGRYLKF